MKIVFISSMLPSGHFSQILTYALAKKRNTTLIVYTDNEPTNLQIKNCGIIRPIWSKTAKYIYEILQHIDEDKPDIIHIQHEFNMYGTIKNAILFPFLPLLLRLKGYKVVVTIHAAVYRKQVNSHFISLFTSKISPVINPLTLALFFDYTYRTISLFTDGLICHSRMMKDILTNDWGVDPTKTYIVPTGIPPKKMSNHSKKKYFLYFGYMVRRNGLQYVLDGFSRFIKKNKKFKLILAGGTIEGQEYALEEIKNYIKKRGLEKYVQMRGFIDQDQQDALFERAYAVVIPAEISMGSSGRLYHAQSYGKCIIASRVGHFLEDIEDKKDGILIDNRHWHQAFKLVSSNRKLLSQIEENVRKKAKNKSSSHIAKRHLTVYTSIINS